nr:PREDICTED: trichohyalin-like [Lepisosteus oculatus]
MLKDVIMGTRRLMWLIPRLSTNQDAAKDDTQKSTSREPSPRGGAKLRKEELQRELQLSTERQRDREGQRRKEREVERVGEGQREREAGRPGDRKGETSHRTRDRGGMADDEREREKRRRQREKERAADLQARGKESWREGRRQAERERADAMSWNGRGATTMDRDGLRDRETEGQREARQAGTYPRAEKRRTDKGREGERRLERQGRMEEEGRDSGREGERRRERNSEAGRQRVEETARQKGTEGIRERLRQGEGGRPPREPQRARDRDRGSELYARDREGVKDQPRDREREDEKQGERRRERKDRLAPGEREAGGEAERHRERERGVRLGEAEAEYERRLRERERRRERDREYREEERRRNREKGKEADHVGRERERADWERHRGDWERKRQTWLLEDRAELPPRERETAGERGGEGRARRREEREPEEERGGAREGEVERGRQRAGGRHSRSEGDSEGERRRGEEIPRGWRSEGDVVREPEGEGDGESVGEGWEEEGRGGESDRGSWGEREQESEGERVRTPRDQLSGEDGFVTVSSGGEGEEFEDCKEFLEVARAQGGDGAASHVMRQPTEYWDCLSEREQTEEREEERPREVETAHKGGTENERRRRHTERGPEEGGEGEGREEGWPRGETDTVQQGWQEREGGEGEKENVDQVGDTRRPRVRVFCVIGQNLPQGTGLEREHRPPTDAEVALGSGSQGEVEESWDTENVRQTSTTRRAIMENVHLHPELLDDKHSNELQGEIGVGSGIETSTQDLHLTKNYGTYSETIDTTTETELYSDSERQREHDIYSENTESKRETEDHLCDEYTEPTQEREAEIYSENVELIRQNESENYSTNMWKETHTDLPHTELGGGDTDTEINSDISQLSRNSKEDAHVRSLEPSRETESSTESSEPTAETEINYENSAASNADGESETHFQTLIPAAEKPIEMDPPSAENGSEGWNDNNPQNEEGDSETLSRNAEPSVASLSPNVENLGTPTQNLQAGRDSESGDDYEGSDSGYHRLSQTEEQKRRDSELQGEASTGEGEANSRLPDPKNGHDTGVDSASSAEQSERDTEANSQLPDSSSLEDFAIISQGAETGGGGGTGEEGGETLQSGKSTGGEEQEVRGPGETEDGRGRRISLEYQPLRDRGEREGNEGTEGGWGVQGEEGPEGGTGRQIPAGNDGEIQEIGQRDTQHEQELGTDGEMSGNAERRTEREPQTGAPLRVEIENDRDMVIRAHSESESETNLCLSKTPLVKANSCPNSLESPSNEQHPWAAERAEGENGSFRDQGQQARVRRRGFRKTMERDRERWSIMESSEGRDEEEGENRRRDRRTRVFNTSDDDDELSISLSEVDLRQMALKHVAGHLRKRNSKFFQSYSQLYQQYREVVLDREIQRQSRSDTLSEEHTPQEVQRIQSRPLPLPPPTHFLALPLAPSPSASAARSPSPSPRLSLSFASSPSLWQELPGVRDSAALSGFGQDRRRLQEVQFEVVSSEASYARSLDIAVDHFQHSSQLGALLSAQDRNWLFSRLSEVRAVSHRFLAELEERVEQDILNFTVCDIIERHCPWFRQVYVPYLTNQSYQEKTFQRLMESCPGFQRVVEKLERNPMCQRLPLRSFLILPFQRITRLKLLVQNILKRTPHNSAEEFQASRALKSLEKLIQESNNSIRQMKSIENLVSLSARVEFECRVRSPPAPRCDSAGPQGLLELQFPDTTKRYKNPISSHCSATLQGAMGYGAFFFLQRPWVLHLPDFQFAIWHHTHTDCLLPLSLSSFLRGGRLLVFEYAPVSQVRVENCRVKLHSLQKNLFRLHLAQTSEGHSKALLLRTDTQSNKLRWISALSQPHPEIDFTTAQDSPQVQCLRSYVSQQPDELTLEKADVLLVHQQSSDGWVEGTRLSDCERGWFPLSHVELISSRHARELNLLDTQKVTTATCKGTRP